MRGATRREFGELHTRASFWYHEHGDIAHAIEHALSARDERRLAELFATDLQQLVRSTPHATLCRWLEPLSDAVLLEHPALAVAGAWLMLQRADLERTRRYARLIGETPSAGWGPFGESSPQSAQALLAAALGWVGVSQIGKSAQLVHRSEPPISHTYRVASLFLGASFLLRDRRAAARDLLEDAAELGPSPLDIGVIAHALLALLDLEEHHYAAAPRRESDLRSRDWTRGACTRASRTRRSSPRAHGSSSFATTAPARASPCRRPPHCCRAHRLFPG